MTTLRPRPYQTEDAQWLLDKQRAAIHHDPGLGKTLIAAEAATANLPALVVCPSYITDQWEDFLNAQYPNASVTNATTAISQRTTKSVKRGVTRTRASKLQRANAVLGNPIGTPSDFTIINKEMLRTFPIPSWYKTVVLDEAHHFRHNDSAQAKAAMELCEKTPYVYQLTGTPIVREPDDLYYQMRILNPNPSNKAYDTPHEYYLTSYDKFIYHYCHVEQGSWGRRVRGGYTGRIKELLAVYAKRRTYREVSLYLPRLIENTIALDFEPDSRRRYDAIRDQYRDVEKDLVFTNAMQVMQALRRATLTPEKLEAVTDIVGDTKQPSVIFTWYKESAHRVHGALQALKLDSCVITGDTQPQARQHLAASHDYVVADIAALSEGCDLTRAKVCIFVEEYYTPGVMKQALARVRRFTENRGSVLCYYLHHKHSIDEIVHRKQTDRAATAESIVREALDD